MSNEDIFKSQAFTLPKERKKEDFLMFLRIVHSEFRTNLQSFNGRLKNSLSGIENNIYLLSDSILEAVETYLNGDTIKAYAIFEKGLNQVTDYLWIKKGVTDLEGFENPEEFYKARIGNSILFSRNDMFHIPFEKRHLVNTQRYSIPGLPCIYLANSTYLCWEELGRPEFEKLQFSRFDLTKGNFQFLNLNHTNQAISFFAFDNDGDLNMMSDIFVLRYLATWPLQASVSIMAKYRDAAFKPEYIVPQMLLQWVINTKDINGIRYFSTRVKGTTPVLHFGNLSNIVIPIKETYSEGLCKKLSEKLFLTNPISYEYASLINPQLNLDKIDLSKPENLKVTMKPVSIKLYEDMGVAYVNTKFGQLERLLNKAETKKVYE